MTRVQAGKQNFNSHQKKLIFPGARLKADRVVSFVRALSLPLVFSSVPWRNVRDPGEISGNIGFNNRYLSPS